MDDILLDANGPAYTSSQERHGVPLDYVGEKLGTAIEELHRLGHRHPEQRRELLAPMYYAVVAYLGRHNMLAKANDRTLAARLLDAHTEQLDARLALVRGEGDVTGLAGLDPD